VRNELFLENSMYTLSEDESTILIESAVCSNLIELSDTSVKLLLVLRIPPDEQDMKTVRKNKRIGITLLFNKFEYKLHNIFE
jgi:hypothetical protein